MLVRKKKSHCDWNLQRGYGRIWGWIALEPRSRLAVNWSADGQTLDACRAFVSALKSKLATIPLFITDELGHYEVVLWELYCTCSPPASGDVPPRGDRARQVHPDLDYVRVVKERHGRRVVKVDTEVMYGDPRRIAQRLNGRGISTAYVERLNGTLRHHSRNLVRKSIAFSKVKEHFEARLDIFLTYYNLVRPHSSLQGERDGRETDLTPAQAVGLCANRWELKQLLAYPSI